MRIWRDLPDDVVAQLTDQGQDLSQSALEGFAIDAYRMRRVTGHQLCQLLGISSRDELDRFLKHHGVRFEYTLEGFERENETSARLWHKYQQNLGTRPQFWQTARVIVVADASPLRYLILIEHAHVLPALYDGVIMPPTAAAELRQETTPDRVKAGCRTDR